MKTHSNSISEIIIDGTYEMTDFLKKKLMKGMETAIFSKKKKIITSKIYLFCLLFCG